MTVDEAINLGLTHHQAGRLAEAEQVYRQVLAAVPDHPGVLHLLGVLAHQVGQSQPAVDLIRRSLAVAPSGAAWSNLGEVLRHLGRHHDAVDAYQRAIAIEPGMATAYSNLGLTLQAERRFAEAEPVLRRSVELDPMLAAGWQNLCNTLGDLGKTAEAVAAGRKAVELNPGGSTAWSDYAVACVEDGQLTAAKEALSRAIALEPDRADARHNLGQVLLRTGEFEKGWEEYEWRWKCPGFPSPVRNFPRPLWTGQDLGGKTILLHAEQGLGDGIMFARYIPLVKERRGTVVVECQPELVELIRPLAGDSRVIARGEELPSFDFHAPFLSLPRAFHTTVATIPWPGAYVHAEIAKSEYWRVRLGGDSRLKVGIAWAGRPTHKNDHNRSVSLARFGAIADPRVTFYSLQVGPASTQAANPPPGMNLVDLSSDLREYGDTAAVVANLDLVISVDTSVVHLTGAMGKPVWTLLPFAADWRWIEGRDDSPWYPTMRLFRMKRPGEWPEVFERVARQLHESLP